MDGSIVHVDVDVDVARLMDSSRFLFQTFSKLDVLGSSFRRLSILSIHTRHSRNGLYVKDHASFL